MPLRFPAKPSGLLIESKNRPAEACIGTLLLQTGIDQKHILLQSTAYLTVTLIVFPTPFTA